MTTSLYNSYSALNFNELHSPHSGLWFERFFDAYDRNWEIPKPNKETKKDVKRDWINNVTGKVGNLKQLQAFQDRQQALLKVIDGKQHCYKTDWHFVTGMGNPHPVENGFSWHSTLAVPYLSGSAVKGLVRAWVEMNDEGLSNDEIKERLKHWFGSENKDNVTEQSGNFIFFDALPNEPPTLLCDIMTPHMGKWYEQGDKANKEDPSTIPADWHEPVPVPFLAVKKAQFIFSIAARDSENKAHVEELTDIFAALEKALCWLGAGAKTAAGYGYMNEHEDFAAALKAQQSQQAEQDRNNQALEEKLKNSSELAQTYFKQAAQQDWENNKDKFLQNSEIENWLEKLENSTDKDILTDLVSLLNKHVVGLLENPNKTQGKKAKSVYSDRQQKIAMRIKNLQG